MKTIVFNPLGWKSNIWRKAQFPQGTIYIDFDQSGYNDVMRKCVDIFTRLAEPCIIIASSYGSQFFLQLIDQIDSSKISKIYLLDGLEQMPDKAGLEQMIESRIDSFESQNDYRDYFLDENDRQDEFRLDLIDSVFRSSKGKYHHMLSNKNFLDYLIHIDICPIEILNSITADITIYSSIDIDYPHIEINPKEHLVMLERSDIINDILNNIKILRAANNDK